MRKRVTVNRSNNEKEIFGMLFKTSNVLQVYLDRILHKENLTGKQLFLMIVVGTFGEISPTLKEVSDRSGSSYQNVKQLALKLEKQGYLEINQDLQDKRRKNLKMTKEAVKFWEKRENQDIGEMKKLFKGFTDDETDIFLKCIMKLLSNIEDM